MACQQFDEGSEYLLGPMEPRQSGSSERSSSPFSLSGIGPSTSPVKHGVIRRPAATEGDAREAWASVSVTTPTLSSPMTPTSSEPQSPQTSSPAAQDKGFSASSTETLVFAGADSPYSSPTLSSVSDELKDRKRGDKTTGDGQWSFFKHSINVRRSLGVSDSEDDIDSDKTTTETA